MEKEILKLSKFKLSVDNGKSKKVLIDNSNSIDFIANAGDSILIIGPNGTGKSTLIKKLLGTSDTKSGVYLEFDDFLFCGKEKYGLLDEAALALNDSDLKIILNDSLKVKSYFKDLLDDTYKENEAFIKDLLERFYGDNKSILKKKIVKLSSGQQKKLMLIGALMKKNKKIYFFDEPMNCLDVSSMKNFLDELNLLRKREPDSAIIIISHCLLFDNPQKVYKIINNKMIDYTLDYKKMDCLKEL